MKRRRKQTARDIKNKAALLSFAYWVIRNRMIWVGFDPSKAANRKHLWDAAEDLLKEWRKHLK